MRNAPRNQVPVILMAPVAPLSPPVMARVQAVLAAFSPRRPAAKLRPLLVARVRVGYHGWAFLLPKGGRWIMTMADHERRRARAPLPMLMEGPLHHRDTLTMLAQGARALGLLSAEDFALFNQWLSALWSARNDQQELDEARRRLVAACWTVRPPPPAKGAAKGAATRGRAKRRDGTSS